MQWIARSLPCRVGGGIRSVDRARLVLEAGAQQVIAGSALFKDGAPDLEFARTLAEAVGRERVIAAVDSRGGHVVIHGWKTTLPLTAADAVAALEPFCDEFLYTHVDTEGLMGGTSLASILAVTKATTRRAHRRRRHHHPGRRSTSSTPWAWTPSSAWRSTPGP